MILQTFSTNFGDSPRTKQFWANIKHSDKTNPTFTEGRYCLWSVSSSIKWVQGCDYCIFALPCRCSLITEKFYFPPRLTFCQNHTNNIMKLHPFNLVLLQEFFDNTKIQNVFADTTYANPMNVMVPNFKIYQHDMHKIIADDKNSDLSLSRITDQVKNDQVTVQSLTAPLLEGQLNIEPHWPDLNAFLRFATMAAITVCTLFMIRTFLKMRRLTAMVAALNQPNVNQCTIFCIQTSSWPSESTEAFNLNFEVAWDHAIFFALFVKFHLVPYKCI